LHIFVQPETPIVSFLTPITGISQHQLVGAVPKAEALAQVQQLMGPDVLLVGQSPTSDIEWLQLQKGVHFAEHFDLAQHFRAWNPKFSSFPFFSLQHEANTLLGVDMEGHHDPSEDAQMSIRLYNRFRHASEATIRDARNKLVRTPQKRLSVAKSLDFKYVNNASLFFTK
jgi:DNA polymerase III alpha subunit (gram-positive type)